MHAGFSFSYPPIFVLLRQSLSIKKSYVGAVQVYTIEARGRGAGELSQREGESGNGNTGEYRSQSWVKNTNMTEFTQDIGYLQSINSDKHLPQGPFTGQFLYDNILHCLL